MKKIAIIGANEFQKRLILKAKDMGIETHVFAWEEGAVAKDVADYFYPISIIEKDKILNIIEGIKVDGICSIASDLAMPTVNYIAQKLNFISNSNECTIVTTNKFKMRELLKQYNMPIPEYQLIKRIEDIDQDKLRYPVIIKPIDRSGSRGVYKATNKYELDIAIKNAIEVSFTDEILVEEYVDGKEYSIESISENGLHNILQITEKFTSGAPNFIEIAHLSPARIDDDLKNRVFDIVEKSLVALNIQNGASHSEIKISKNGDIKIIEIAARMGGDFIGSDMVEISTGFDFVRNIINIALGDKIESKNNVSSKTAIVRFIFDELDIQNFNMLRIKYPSIIKDFNIKSKIEEVTDSSTRNGYCILEIQNKNHLEEVMDTLKIN